MVKFKCQRWLGEARMGCLESRTRLLALLSMLWASTCSPSQNVVLSRLSHSPRELSDAPTRKLISRQLGVALTILPTEFSRYSTVAPCMLTDRAFVASFMYRMAARVWNFGSLAAVNVAKIVGKYRET